MDQRTPSHSSRDKSPNHTPLAYFITFSCYGTRLHGDERGSVDRDRNTFDTPFIDPDQKRKKAEQQRMKQEPYNLDDKRRTVIQKTILEVCEHRNWRALAIHVRTNHIHVVGQGDVKPERMLNDFKRYGSQRLNEHGFDHPDRKRWAYHGSTKYLWNPENVQNALRYTLHEQGESLNTFIHPFLKDMSFETYDNRLNPDLRTVLKKFWND